MTLAITQREKTEGSTKSGSFDQVTNANSRSVMLDLSFDDLVLLFICKIKIWFNAISVAHILEHLGKNGWVKSLLFYLASQS